MRHIPSAVAAMLAAIVSFATYGEMTAQSYVQDGLIGLWDGRENAGWGQHDDAATVWKDLTGQTCDLEIGPAGTFRSDCLEKTAAGVMASNAVFLTGIRAVEVVVSQIPATGWVLPVHVTNRTMIAINDNYNSSGRRGFAVDYYGNTSIQTADHAPVANISVNYWDDPSWGIHARGVLQNGLGGTKLNAGFNPRLDFFSVGCRTSVQSGNEYAVTGYKVHVIRFYDHELTANERRQNLAVDCERYGVLAPVPCIWTGEGLDGRFSNAENWVNGIKPRLGGVTNEIMLAAQNETTIENDIGPLLASKLHVSRASGNAALTLAGQPFELTGAGGNSKDSFHNCTFTNSCPLTVEQDLTFSATDAAALFQSRPLTLNGDVTILAEAFMFAASDSGATFMLNGTLTAKEVGSYGNHTLDFYRPVTVRKLIPGRYNSSDGWRLWTSGNVADEVLVGYYGNVCAEVENAFPSDMVFRWWTVDGQGGYPTSGAKTTNEYTLYRLFANQTCDRIEAEKLTNTTGRILYRSRIRSDAGNPVLTLKGTADALSYGVLESKASTTLSVVWDPIGPYTQTFADQSHSMKGELVVKGGTLASAGTNVFPSVKTLRVGDGARFRVAASTDNAAVNPFPGTTALSVSGTGKVEVPSGVTMTVGETFVRGVLQLATLYQRKGGTHTTATKVDWVTGDGLVSVGTCNGTSWAADADGDWNDADNWSHGVPSGTAPVYLTVEGAKYTATMKTGDGWPVNLVIRGTNATCALGANQTIEYDGSGRTSSIVIDEGGTLSVVGTLVLTNYAGTFTIGSSDTSVTSRLAVSGTALYAPSTASAKYRIGLNPSGVIEVPGGTLSFVRNGDSGALNQMGGSVLASGSGKIVFDSGDSEKSTTTYFGWGTVVFSGQSTITRAGKSPTYVWGPRTAGTSLSISLRDQAVWGIVSDGFTLGQANAAFLLDFDSEAVHSKLGNRVRVSTSGTGTSELRLGRGKIEVGGRGFDVCDAAATTVSHGTLTISGGWLYNGGSNGGWSDQGKQNGLTVGYGANSPGTAGTVAFGEVYQSGGTNETVSGVTLVGVGYGEGKYIQTGGYYWHDSTSQVFGLGAVGGHGYWTVSNGTLLVKGDAYFGGFHSNILTKAEKMKCWPETRHDAEGTLVAAGGKLEFQKKLVLGADGRGTVDLIGTNATFTVKGDLILSNQVANAASGGTLVFRLKDGLVAPIAVTKKMIINTGAELIVDVGDVAPAKAQRLVTATAGVTGTFDSAKVSVVGAAAKTTRLIFDEKGVRVKAIRGLVVFLR